MEQHVLYPQTQLLSIKKIFQSDGKTRGIAYQRCYFTIQYRSFNEQTNKKCVVIISNQFLLEHSDEQVDEQDIGDKKINRHQDWNNPGTSNT